MTHHITHIKQIMIPVNDLGRAVSFYAKKLGLQFLFQTGQLAFFNLGEVRLMLSLPEQGQFLNPSSIIYLNVSDIHQAYHDFSQSGILFLDTPHHIATIGKTETWMCFFKDSENNTLGLISEVIPH
jgi:methylmalonyl-CoA/ethylmalonyl-CoA epimerase